MLPNDFFNYNVPEIINNPDGTVTIGGVTYAGDGSGIIENYGANTLNTSSATPAQLDAISANNGVIDPGDPAFAGLSTVELLTLGQELGATTTGSSLEEDARDLELVSFDFNADVPTTFTDPNTGLTISESEFNSLYGGNTGVPTNPNVVVNDDGSRINTDPDTGIIHYFAADGTLTGSRDADGVFTSYVDNNDPPPPGNDPPESDPPEPEPDPEPDPPESDPPESDPPEDTNLTLPSSTSQEIADALVNRGLGSTAKFFLQGSTSLDDIIARYGGDESFMDLVNRYDPTTMPEFTGNYTYNPYNQDFGAGTGRNQVYYIDPTTGKAAMGLASEVSALYPGIETFAGVDAFSAANPDPNLFNPIVNTTVDNTNVNTTTGATNYEQLYNDLLAQQNQPQTDYSGLMGLLNQFMQSRNSLQGGGRYNNMYGTMYGGGMGYGSPYGNPFNSGMGYGYGMNPYAGGIGSFYGNTGLGFSPSGYNSGYGSGYGMNNMFYGGFGGNNYNQQQMAYNPYSSLYNQLSNPQTYGYSGDIYTPEYNSYLNTQYEGDRYSQGYQDYLQSNNPGVYNNLFGGSV